DEIIDTTYIKNKDHLSNFGIRDKDLFDLAKQRLSPLSSNNKPFFLFLSTTDTHFPNGIYDKRMEQFIEPKSSELEFMIAATDYLIGDFLLFLKKNNFLDNTIVFIMPDHLKMGDPSIFEETEERMLYVITNAATKTISSYYDKTTYQIDLPKLILDGAEVKHNMTFFTDLISGSKKKFIQDNIYAITEINRAGLLMLNSDPLQVSKNHLTYKNDTARFIAHAGGKIEDKTYTNSLEALNYSYHKGFRLFELDIISTRDGHFVGAHDWNHWKKISQYQGVLPPTLEEFLQYKLHKTFTPLDMDRINNWFRTHKDAILVTDKINEPKLFSDQFIDSDRLMMELFSLDAIKEGISCGIKSSMASQNVVRENSVETLANLGVKDIAISYRIIEQDRNLFSKIKELGMRTFVFHVNLGYGDADEEYIVKCEMDHIYGLYADKWTFDNQ
ncbi:MAG: sulfatase-like hydrolase/transferase, partial [Fibrobacteria bacterium]|nr:sulfatase-like hydrolase/transferase [Fibrobacteria bacterium]